MAYPEDPQVMSTATPRSFAEVVAQNRDAMRATNEPQMQQAADQLDSQTSVGTTPASASPVQQAAVLPPPASPLDAVMQADATRRAKSDAIMEQVTQLAKKVADQTASDEQKGKWGLEVLDNTIGKNGLGLTPARAALFAIGAVLGGAQRNGTGLSTGIKLMQLPDVWEKQKSDMMKEHISTMLNALNVQGQVDARNEQVLDRQRKTAGLEMLAKMVEKTDPTTAAMIRTGQLSPELAKLIGVQPPTLSPNYQLQRDPATGGYKASLVPGAPDTSNRVSMGTDFDRFAQELFPGRSPNSLNSVETKSVNDRVSEYNLAVNKQKLEQRHEILDASQQKKAQDALKSDLVPTLQTIAFLRANLNQIYPPNMGMIGSTVNRGKLATMTQTGQEPYTSFFNRATGALPRLLRTLGLSASRFGIRTIQLEGVEFPQHNGTRESTWNTLQNLEDMINATALAAGFTPEQILSMSNVVEPRTINPKPEMAPAKRQPSTPAPTGNPLLDKYNKPIQ